MRFILVIFSLLLSGHAHAFAVQEIKEGKNLSAYFVESGSLPMVTLEVSFKAGSYFDKAEKQGTARLTARLMAEAHGGLTSEKSLEKWEEIGTNLGVRVDENYATFTLYTLSKFKNEAVELLTKTLTNPSFNKADFERLKSATFSTLNAQKQNPASVASNLLRKATFEGHPYANATEGTEETLKNIELSDIKAFYKEFYNQKNMVISVVGDATEKDIKKWLKRNFKHIKKGETVQTFASAPFPVTPSVVRKEMNVPQSTIHLSHEGITRNHPDYYAVFVMNYILGGGGFNSRLMEEVREKRGLAYSVYSQFNPSPAGATFTASVNTKNEDAEKSISLIKTEMARIKKGVTTSEFEGAKAFLEGSFPLRLDSNAKILSHLTLMQMENLGIHYLDNWVENIRKVTLQDVKNASEKHLKEDALITIIVGGN